MPQRYVCPICRQNRSQFEIIYRLAQQIQKDPETGALLYVSDTLEMPMLGSRPELEVRCQSCGYTGTESIFIKTAAKEERSTR